MEGMTMKRKRTLLTGLLAVLLLAALGVVVYRFRNEIAEKTGTLIGRLRSRCRCGREYDDYADV